MTALASRLDTAQAHLHKLGGAREALDRQAQQISARIQELEENIATLKYVSQFFRHLIDSEIMRAVNSVADLQTEGLREIFFDQKLKVIPQVEESRGKISVKFVVQHEKKGSVVEGDPLKSFGGSVQVMMSILLRITVIFRRGLRPVLLLDETLSAVADQYKDRAVDFLSSLCSRMGLDILLVSHDDTILGKAKRAYAVSMRQGAAVFKPLSTQKKR